MQQSLYEQLKEVTVKHLWFLNLRIRLLWTNIDKTGVFLITFIDKTWRIISFLLNWTHREHAFVVQSLTDGRTVRDSLCMATALVIWPQIRSFFLVEPPQPMMGWECHLYYYYYLCMPHLPISLLHVQPRYIDIYMGVFTFQWWWWCVADHLCLDLCPGPCAGFGEQLFQTLPRLFFSVVPF